MGIKSTLSVPLARIVTKRIHSRAQDPVGAQRKVLRYLLNKGRSTSFGIDHRFGQIDGHESLTEAVPLRDYEALRPYIDRVVAGESDILWPGKPLYLCKTSGTTSGAKFIPLTKELLSNQISSARNALLAHINHSGDASFLGGKMIFLQGSPELDERGAIPVGRLSGIVARHVPHYLQGNRLPSYETNTITDWESKVDAIVDETHREDMRLISGIPSWVQMYFEKLIQRTGHSTISEIFPNFSLFVHGGVNYEPYRANMERLMGRPIPSLETFPASEGFFGYQDGDIQDGLLLVVDRDIYYEFIPADEIHLPNPSRLHAGEVELNRNYAMVLHTSAGLWGYEIGDMIRFTSLRPLRIQVVGRTKHFTSAFGEHVIAAEVDRAMSEAMDAFRCEASEFTVAPRLNPDEGLPHHEWFIEFNKAPDDMNAFAEFLDASMQEQNPYYHDLRIGHVLQPLKVVTLKPNAFYQYMHSMGKLGGQNKIARLSNDRLLADALMKHRLVK